MEEDDSYFYLYRISYMWYCPLGFLVTVIVGCITSWIARRIFKEKLTEVDPSLLSPIMAERVRKRREKTSEFRSTIVLDKDGDRTNTYI